MLLLFQNVQTPQKHSLLVVIIVVHVDEIDEFILKCFSFLRFGRRFVNSGRNSEDFDEPTEEFEQMIPRVRSPYGSEYVFIQIDWIANEFNETLDSGFVQNCQVLIFVKIGEKHLEKNKEILLTRLQVFGG